MQKFTNHSKVLFFVVFFLRIENVWSLSSIVGISFVREQYLNLIANNKFNSILTKQRVLPSDGLFVWVFFFLFLDSFLKFSFHYTYLKSTNTFFSSNSGHNNNNNHKMEQQQKMNVCVPLNLFQTIVLIKEEKKSNRKNEIVWTKTKSKMVVIFCLFYRLHICVCVVCVFL